MNKRRAARLLACLLAFVLVLTLAGCGSELNGKWRSTSEKKTQLAFSSTGKATMSADGIELSGPYTISGDQLSMVLSAPDGEVYAIDATYEIEDKRLYLENPKGQIEVFER